MKDNETKDSKKVQDCVIAQIKPLRYKKRKDFYEIDINVLKNIIIVFVKKKTS